MKWKLFTHSVTNFKEKTSTLKFSLWPVLHLLTDCGICLPLGGNKDYLGSLFYVDGCCCVMYIEIWMMKSFPAELYHCIHCWPEFSVVYHESLQTRQTPSHRKKLQAGSNMPLCVLACFILLFSPKMFFLNLNLYIYIMYLCLQSVKSARTFSRRSVRPTGLRCLSETHLQHWGRPTERRSPSPQAWRSSPVETRWMFAAWIQTSPRGRCSVLTRGSWCPKTSRPAHFPGS